MTRHVLSPAVYRCLVGTTVQVSAAAFMLIAALSTSAAPSVTTAAAADQSGITQNRNAQDVDGENTDPTSLVTTTQTTAKRPTLQSTLQPSHKALAAANQTLLSRNAQLQRQVNDLQTQVNVLIYESKGQLFLYGALTVLVSLLLGAGISWLVLSRRTRW